MSDATGPTGTVTAPIARRIAEAFDAGADTLVVFLDPLAVDGDRIVHVRLEGEFGGRRYSHAETIPREMLDDATDDTFLNAILDRATRYLVQTPGATGHAET